jgi:zinc protease
MICLRRLFAAAILAAASLAVAEAQGSTKLKLPELKYETYTLPNGLKIITHEDHRLPLVAVDLWYHVGPLNEREGRTGFAHLFEHMMFEGSEHVGEKAHIKYVQGAGATDVNGTTNFDRTNYFETLPANQLELGLWLESDRMGFLMEGLDRKLLQNQRDVVRNERRQGEGRPYSVADETSYHLLFPKGHPYYASVIGSHADIEAARIADIRDFHQQFYTPNNASIAVAGDFNPAQLKSLLTKYFGPIPKGPDITPVHVVTPPITAQKRATVTDTVVLPRLDVSWLTPPAFTPGDKETQIVMFVLGGAKASRLDEALVYKTQVAQSVRCETDAEKLASVADCSIVAKPGVKLEDLEATLWSELAKLQTDGPTAAEVEAAKTTELSHKIVGLQRLGGFGGVADTLDLYNQYTGDPGYLAKDLASIQAVDVASTKAAAAKYFTKDAAVVVYTIKGEKHLDDVPRSPEDTDADVKITNPYTPQFEASQDWRKTPPKAGPPVAVHLPVPEEIKLANGLEVLLVQAHSLPLISAMLAVKAGSENNPRGKEGLSSLTASAMGEQTTTRSLEQLADAEERLGTRIVSLGAIDGSTVSMTVLSNHAGESMDLFSDVVEHPAFKEDDLDRLRKQRLTGIRQEGDNVQAMAMRVGPRILYGDEQPYGTPVVGTTESVGALTRADVLGFYKAHYGPADAALVLVGDVTPAEAKKLGEQYFGNWSGTASAAATLPAAPAAPSTHIVIVDKPGAPQTALFAYGLGVPANSPDVPAIQVMNYTLGAAFASRINMNLRERHGYTYGARSVYSSYRAGGPFFAGGLVRTNVTAEAAKELMGEIARFPANPPTDAELLEAKTASVQRLPGAFEVDSTIAESMSTLFLLDRPLNYYATLPARYGAVTSAEVARVAKEYVHPDQLIIVAAGDRAKIEPTLASDGLGPEEVRDIDGAPAK